MGRGSHFEACKSGNKRRKTMDVGIKSDKILGSKDASCTASQAQVASLDIVDLSPERFWREQISQRKPLLIHGYLQDSQFRASRWTNDYLHSKAVRPNANLNNKQKIFIQQNLFTSYKGCSDKPLGMPG